MGDVGIQIEPTPLQGPAYHRKVFEPVVGPDLLMANQRGSRSELLGPVDETLASGSVFFQGVKRPAGFDDLLNRALQQETVRGSLNYLLKMEKLAYNDAMFTPLYAVKLIVAQSPAVKGAIWFYSGIPYPDLSRAWLDR